MNEIKSRLLNIRDTLSKKGIIFKKPKKLTVNLKIIKGEWEVDQNEQMAAWELYVEIITRISVEELKPNEGLLREVLSSLYAIFGETRKVLRKYGPSIAIPKGEGNLSLGTIAVKMLNSALRPVLAKWHPLLLSYENIRKPGVSPPDHEAQWERNDELRKVIKELQEIMKQYSLLLAKAAGVPPII